MKKISLLLLVGILVSILIGGCAEGEEAPIGMAVEFNSHPACAYIARDKGWFEEEGLELATYESYITGVALAAALARGDIEVAYLCLPPAILAYANARVPIKIVAGTHKYGFGLVVNPDRVKTVSDLEKPDVRLGCLREGAATDVFFHKTIEKFNLDESRILNKVQRMNPPQQVLAIKMGQLDAAFLPEQWATMAEDFGFKILLMSQDVWPEMQGSVLVVKEDLINDHPEVVRRLVRVTQKATDWANEHPDEAARVVARQLRVTGGEVFPLEVAETVTKLEITPEIISRSMGRLEYTTSIEPEVVQDTIDYLVELGYIKNSFNCEDILDLRYLQ